MSLETAVQDALQAAGDATGAFLWRRVCRDLGGPVRVALLSRDDGGIALARALLPTADIEWVEVPIDDEEVGLGTEDRILACHAAIAVTPYSRALGSRERERLAALAGTAPSTRHLFLVGRELLERLSDRPEEEAQEVLQRARAIAPKGWEVAEESALRPWASALSSRRRDLTRLRIREVAGLLLDDARRALAERLEQSRAQCDAIEALLGAEDAALDAARQRGRRTAAHVLGAVRRQTDELLIDLRAFLLHVEQDLPMQADAIEALPTLRRALPHWLHHIVEGWLHDRLGQWRTDLVADLEAVGLTDEDAAMAELVVPAMSPGPVHGDGNWTSRLGATAALGGGAALLIAGLWFPALLAVTGGIAWSALGNAATQAESRRRVVDAAIDALRTMARDAEALLQDQIRHVEARLQALEADEAEAHAAARQAVRSGLEARRTAATSELSEHMEAHRALTQATATLRDAP